jgi:hypothetical protein
MVSNKEIGAMKRGISNCLMDRVSAYIKAYPNVTRKELQKVFNISESKASVLYKRETTPFLSTYIFGHKDEPYFTEDEMLNSPVYKAEDLKGWELETFNTDFELVKAHEL